MKTFADFEVSNGRTVICDFVAPVPAAREQFDADRVIWVDTIEEGRFEDTNKMFEAPDKFDTHIRFHLTDEQIETFANTIKEQWYV